MADQITESNLGDELRGVLNSHGHPFQYAVIRAAHELSEKQKTEWVFEAAEVPVSVRGKETRIDLILRQRNSRLYLVGECKRTNPALSNWCFVRAPYTRRNSTNRKLFIQNIRVVSGGAYPGVSTGASDLIYHLGYEVKSNLRGEKTGGGRGAIEEAAGQVSLGLNGMVEFHAARQQFKDMEGKPKFIFIPAIFTTARIFTSEIDLGSADINDGKLAAGSVNAVEKPWIWWNYPVSPSLKHSRQVESSSFELGDIYEQEHVRSIVIVGSKGIDEFLGLSWRFDE